MKKGDGLMFLAIALLFIMFAASDCSKQDSIAQAIVKHLESK